MPSPIADFMQQFHSAITLVDDNAPGHQLPYCANAGEKSNDEDFTARWLQMQDTSAVAMINELETHKTERWGSHYTRWSWPMPSVEEKPSAKRRNSDGRPPSMPERQRSISDENKLEDHQVDAVDDSPTPEALHSPSLRPLANIPTMPVRQTSTGDSVSRSERCDSTVWKEQQLQAPPRIPVRQKSVTEEHSLHIVMMRGMAA